MKKKLKISKRYVQLLEVMVAATIVLLCIIPALQVFTNIYVKQQVSLKENQRDHLVHLVHAKITEQLYKRMIPLETILEKQEVEFTDPIVSPELAKWNYKSSYVFERVDEHKPKEKEEADKYLAHLLIKMKEIPTKGSQIKKATTLEHPSETTYNYVIYIDAGAMKDSKGNKKNEVNERFNDPDKPKLEITN